MFIKELSKESKFVYIIILDLNVYTKLTRKWYKQPKARTTDIYIIYPQSYEKQGHMPWLNFK